MASAPDAVSYGDGGAPTNPNAVTYYLKATLYLISWGIFSGLIILLNNWIMNFDGFPYPITLSATGPLVSWCIAAFLVIIGHSKLERRVTASEWFTSVFPIGFFTAVTYAAGNGGLRT